MKNLTNVRLEILTDAFMDKVNAKKEEARQSKKYQEVLEELKKEYEYEELLDMVNRYKELEKKMNELEKEKTEIRETYRKYNKISRRGYYVPRVEGLDKDFQEEADKALDDYFPTKKEVQAKIILMGIKKSKDILQDLADEFEIDESLDKLEE